MGQLVRLRPAPRSGPEPLWRTVIGARLRRLRGQRERTLTDVAERAGISPQYLSEVERGLKDPSSEVVAAVAGALEVTVLDLTALAIADLRASSATTATLAPGHLGRVAPSRASGPVLLAA